MKAADFDKKFDDGEEDIIEYLDLSQMKPAGNEQKRVNVDFPVWMIDALDREASRLGVTRQSIIKVWIAERIEHHQAKVDQVKQVLTAIEKIEELKDR